MKDNFLTDSFITAGLAAPGSGIVHNSACILPSFPSTAQLRKDIAVDCGNTGLEVQLAPPPRGHTQQDKPQISYC